MAILLSAYFYGYCCTQILGGWLAIKFGDKLMLLIGKDSRFGDEHKFQLRSRPQQADQLKLTVTKPQKGPSLIGVMGLVTTAMLLPVAARWDPWAVFTIRLLQGD